MGRGSTPLHLLPSLTSLFGPVLATRLPESSLLSTKADGRLSADPSRDRVAPYVATKDPITKTGPCTRGELHVQSNPYLC